MADYHVIVLMLMGLSMGYMIRAGWWHGPAYEQYRDDSRPTIHPILQPSKWECNSSSSSSSSGTTDSVSLLNNDDHHTTTTTTTRTTTSPTNQRSPSSAIQLSQLSSPYRWSVIPQGWSDDEEYDSNIDDITCRTTPLRNDAHLRNKDTISILTRLGVNLTNQRPKAKPRPWWYTRIVEGSGCQNFTSMRQCHQTALTCQWALQGYCFNYSASSIGWFQAEAYPGGLTNQEISALKGLAIARYAQSKLYDYGIIATLISRLHRQSPTARVKLEGRNNDYRDFRPFRHFFDASSIYCPVDMGPIVERPRLILINSMKVHHFLPAAYSPYITAKFPNGTSAQVPRPGPLLALNQTGMGTFRRPWCDQHSAYLDTHNRTDELTSHYQKVLLTNSPVPHLGIITRTWWCNMDFIWYPIEQQLKFARRWYRLANSVTNAMTKNSSSLTITTPSSPKSTVSYVGFHLRREDDICNKSEASVFFCAWTPQQWMKCLNSFLVQDGHANISIGYVATDRAVVDSKWYAPFRHSLMGNIQWHTKSSLIGRTHPRLMKSLRREELAIVDQLMLAKSVVFAGVQRSSFSVQIAANRRGKKGFFSHLLDRRPPYGCKGVDL